MAAPAIVRRVDRSGPIHVLDVGEAEPSGTGGQVTARLTPEGYLRVRGRVSGCGVYTYDDGEGESWGELRVPDEVHATDSVASWDLRPITSDHPDAWVTAETIRDVQCGSAGTTWERSPDDGLVGEILITDADLIARIRAGVVELSCGYDALVVQDAGVLDGASYSYRQTKIRGNHIAVVDQARGGPECRLLLDSIAVPRGRPPALPTTEDIMKTKKINPDPARLDGVVLAEGVEYEVPDEVAAMIADLQAQLDALTKAEVSTEAPPLAVVSGDSASVVDKRRDERDELVAAAGRILPAGWSARGRTDTQIRREVIRSVGTAGLATKADAASDELVVAYYDAALESCSARVDSSTDLLTTVGRAVAVDTNDGFQIGEAMVAHAARLRDSSQRKAG